MNLTDLVNRKDRSLEILKGEVGATIHTYLGYKMHATRMGSNSEFCLNKAHEFNVLNTFPRLFNWALKYEDNLLTNQNNNEFIIEIESLGQPEKKEILVHLNNSDKDVVNSFLINWPIWANKKEGFNLKIINRSKNALFICSGYAFNPRQKITPLLKGKGVEVGPGMNPYVMPSSDVEVNYVESIPADEWLKLYKKQEKPSKVITENLWSNYIVSDAHELSEIENGSLDFIFSNHVFEHLMNPLQVLENWTSKLKPGAIIAGVIPDCRFTFDLRQEPSKKEEWLHEYNNVVKTIGMNKYERWCEYTAPYNTPENLIHRNYSIHVHYYTPDSFFDFVKLSIDNGTLESAFYNTSPNNKDFGFVLKKS